MAERVSQVSLRWLKRENHCLEEGYLNGGGCGASLLSLRAQGHERKVGGRNRTGRVTPFCVPIAFRTPAGIGTILMISQPVLAPPCAPMGFHSAGNVSFFFFFLRGETPLCCMPTA